MKLIELRAYNKPVNQTIIERFLETGERFIKILPKENMIKAYPTIKQTFSDKPVKVELLNSGWIYIKKLGEDAKLNLAAKEISKQIGKKEVTFEEVAEFEADMLKKSGYEVVIKESEVEYE